MPCVITQGTQVHPPAVLLEFVTGHYSRALTLGQVAKENKNQALTFFYRIRIDTCALRYFI